MCEQTRKQFEREYLRYDPTACFDRWGAEGQYKDKAIWQAWVGWCMRVEVEPEYKHIGYFQADENGDLIWDEGCVCQDPVYPIESDSTDISVRMYVRRDRK